MDLGLGWAVFLILQKIKCKKSMCIMWEREREREREIQSYKYWEFWAFCGVVFCLVAQNLFIYFVEEWERNY